jgi:hypothetical protein
MPEMISGESRREAKPNGGSGVCRQFRSDVFARPNEHGENDPMRRVGRIVELRHTSLPPSGHFERSTPDMTRQQSVQLPPGVNFLCSQGANDTAPNAEKTEPPLCFFAPPVAGAKTVNDVVELLECFPLQFRVREGRRPIKWHKNLLFCCRTNKTLFQHRRIFEYFKRREIAACCRKP